MNFCFLNWTSWSPMSSGDGTCSGLVKCCVFNWAMIFFLKSWFGLNIFIEESFRVRKVDTSHWIYFLWRADSSLRNTAMFICWMNIYMLNLQMSKSIRWSISQIPTAWGFCQGPWADGRVWDKMSEGLMSAMTQGFPLSWLRAVEILLMRGSRLQRLTTFSHRTTRWFSFPTKGNVI